VDAFMGRLGLELGRIRLAKKLAVDEWAPQLASAEASLNRKPMATLRGNAPKDIEDAVNSKVPEEKVVEFQQLETMAENIKINRAEDTKVNKALEGTMAFRAALQAEAGQKGMIATRNRPGQARFDGKVRGLKGGQVEFGRAVDSATGESFPAKLVVAVPPGSDDIPEGAIKQGRPEWRTRQNREIFEPFLRHIVDFVRSGDNGSRSSTKIHFFLEKLKPGLDFGAAVLQAFGAPKSPIKEFLDTFADTFEWNKGLSVIKVRPGVARTGPARRLRGKQPMPEAQPARAGPVRRLRGKQPMPERSGAAKPTNTRGSTKEPVNVRSTASTNKGRFAAGVRGARAASSQK
jgi:hypothetical protein